MQAQFFLCGLVKKLKIKKSVPNTLHHSQCVIEHCKPQFQFFSLGGLLAVYWNQGVSKECTTSYPLRISTFQ